MAVADVPGLGLDHGLQSSTDAITASGLASQLLHVGCHCCLTGGVVGSGVVDEESAVVLFDHALIIGVRGGQSGQQWTVRLPSHS